MTSLLTGWAPNRNVYFTAASMRGPWEPRGPFAHGRGAETTFDSQVTFVLPLAGRPDAFIFMADRYADAKPDGYEVPELRASTHVWLPVELDAGSKTMKVVWRERWELKDAGARR